MIPSNTWPHTHHDLVQHYHTQYDLDVKSGKFQPMIYPWGGLGAFLVIAYMLIPHQNRPLLRRARFAVVALNIAHTIYAIRNVRAKNMAGALGIGLIFMWGVLWIMSITIWNDAQTDFQRVERTEGVFGGTGKTEGRENGAPYDKSKIKSGDKSYDSLDNNTANGFSVSKGGLGPGRRHGEYAWQPYPLTPFIERLDWVLDVFCNFRGAGWNWRVVSTPPPPKKIQEQLRRNSPDPPVHTFRTHASQTRTYSTRRDLLIGNAKVLVMGYLILDALKLYVNHDPYFWGLTDRKPAPYLPAFIVNDPVLTHILRLTISQFAIMWALKTIFSLGPLFFSGLLGPSFLGARAEPWMCSDNWGSYTLVLDKGLAAWWSAWWHQTFRFAFEQPSRKLIEVLGMDQKAPIAKMIQLLVAFGLSGLLHACGSYTCHGPTRPLLGPMRFFLLQALGVSVETLLRQSLGKTGVQNHVPQWLKRSFTFFYVHLWFYYTAGFLTDDFAQGGVWLFEPLPVSLFRGIGLGVEGDSWWCWGNGGLRWHTADRWWKSGIAF